MPGETHHVDYDGDSVSASFQASRARSDVEASRDIDGDTGVNRSRAAGEEFGDRAPWFEIDTGMTDIVMPAAILNAATFDAGGPGGL